LFETCTVPIPWAVQPTPPPAPSISADDAARDAALLEDALLDVDDFPLLHVDAATEQGWDIVRSQSQYYAGFQAGGGEWVASRRWQQQIPDYTAGSFPPETDYAQFSDERLLFDTAAQAAAFLEANPNPLPPNYLRLPEVPSFAPGSHVFSDTPSPEPQTIPVRRVQLRSVVGRIVIQQFLTVHSDFVDWEAVTRQLLETAQQRTQQALAAIGE
jgi:hypothetical protein